MKGQGAVANVKNKFEKFEVDAIWDEEPLSQIKTEFFKTHPKTIVNQVKSVDLPFYQSLNPYQGCEHGCSYCYARPTHEYWGMNAGVDFERKIMYKPNAADLLEKQFNKAKYIPKTISLSGNTDCYQPAEKKFKITRAILEICLKYKHPVSIITKNALILRDLDILIELQKDNLISVALSITTLEEELRRNLEPRTSTAMNKLKTMQILSENNIPVFGMMAPIIPALNSDEIFEVIKQFSVHKAMGFSYTLIRLNDAVEPIFTEWVKLHYPDRAMKVLNQIRELHHGNLGSKTPKERMRGSGNMAESIHQMIKIAEHKFFKTNEFPKLNHDSFLKLRNGQFSLF